MSLNELKTYIDLEMTGDTKRYLVSAKQGDKATRFIVARLWNNGNRYQIPEDAIARVNIKKPDGNFIYNACNVVESEVSIELTNQTLAAAGTAFCDVEIRTSDDKQVITSATFTIEIEKSQRNDEAIKSSNELTAFEKELEESKKGLSDAVRETKEILQNQEQLNETLAEAKEAARSAEQAKTQAQQLAQAIPEAVRQANITLQQAANEQEERLQQATVGHKETLEQVTQEKVESLATFVTAAESYAHGGTGSREGENADNAKKYMELARQAAEEARNIAGGDYITKAKVGAEGGVAGLDENGKVPKEQLPEDIGGGIPKTEKGKPNGVASLGEDGKVPEEQLPEIGGEVVVDGTTITKNPTTKEISVAKKLVDEIGGVAKLKEDLGELDTTVESLKKSVSDGKTLVANAITDKGVETATDATFAVMADNISKIETGGGELHGATISGTTAEPTLLGKEVTLSKDGITIQTTKINDDGTFTFMDIEEVGTYKVSASDDENISTEISIAITAEHIVNKTVLSTELILYFATILGSTDEATLYGQSANLYLGDTLVKSTLISDDGSFSFRIKENGEYTIKASDGSDEASNNISITILDIKNKTNLNISLSFFKIVTWADGSWDEISAMLDAHYEGTIDISDYWTDGDTKIVSLPSISSKYNRVEKSAQQVKLILAHYEHNNLVTPINGKTKSAFCVLQTPFVETDGINSSSSDPALTFNATEMYSWLNDSYINALPSELKNIVKTCVYKTCATESWNGKVNDYDISSKVMLPSVPELNSSFNHAQIDKAIDSTNEKNTPLQYVVNSRLSSELFGTTSICTRNLVGFADAGVMRLGLYVYPPNLNSSTIFNLNSKIYKICPVFCI